MIHISSNSAANAAESDLLEACSGEAPSTDQRLVKTNIMSSYYSFRPQKLWLIPFMDMPHTLLFIVIIYQYLLKKSLISLQTSLVSLPFIYKKNLGMLQAAELLRHPHLQPYLAQYTNLSPVFLPVKSEMESAKTKLPKSELHEKQSKPCKIGQKKQSDATPKMEKIVKKLSSSSDSSTLTDQERLCVKDESVKPSEKMSMERITALVRWNSNKTGSNEGLGDEKAEAMESLLELCAKLLKRERFEELEGVLKPFGEEEAVSSRETAIWLTKGLLNMQRRNEA